MRALDLAAIIVTYRTAELTVAALCSLERERSGATPGLRAIVIDNASGDAPRIERALHDARWSSGVRLVCAPRNGGFAYGNNLGVHHAWAAARPDYVYLLN